jgi:hypothetical protein
MTDRQKSSRFCLIIKCGWPHSFHPYTLFYIRRNIHSAPQTNCPLSISIKYGLNIFLLAFFFFLFWRLSWDYNYVSQEMLTSISLFSIQLTLYFLFFSLVLFHHKFNISVFYSSWNLFNQDDVVQRYRRSMNTIKWSIVFVISWYNLIIWIDCDRDDYETFFCGND